MLCCVLLKVYFLIRAVSHASLAQEDALTPGTSVLTAANFVGAILAVDFSVALVALRNALVPGQALVFIRAARC